MNKKNPDISIIIPIHNAEEYLERCLDSVLNQSFKNIEVIAVDDNSSDNSLNKLKYYADNDERIRILNNYESGVSQARNLGIKNSLGRYIMFVDSDDWIDRDMIEIMYKKAKEENSDMVMCTYVREFRNKSKEKIFKLPKINIYENDKVKSELLRKLIGPVKEELANPEYLDALGTVWAKLYRSDTIKKNNITFNDLKEIGSSEDTLFNIYAFNEFKKVIFINKPMYHYWRDNSKSITSKYTANLKEQRKVLFKYIYDFINRNKFEEIFNEALNNRICISVLGLGLVECCKDNKIPNKDKIKNIKSILDEDYIRCAYKDLELKYFSMHWRIFYFFNKKKMAICSYVLLNLIEFFKTKI